MAAPTPMPKHRQRNASAARKTEKIRYGLVCLLIGLMLVLSICTTAGCAGQPAAAPSYGDAADASSGASQGNEPPPGVRVVDFGKDLERWDEAKREILEAVRNMEPSVYVKNKVRFDWSDLDVGCFWVSGIVDGIGSVQPDAGQDYMWGGLVYFEYNCEMSELADMQQKIDRAAAAILAKIPANADEWETAKIVHDEIVRMAAYDHSLQGPHIRDIYGVLEEGSAVCVGYAYAFDYILEQAPNAPACITRESADRTHAWNEVLFTNGDGKSYLYIDPTWDDPDITDANGNPYVFYDYFCVSPDELEGVDDSHTVGSSSEGEDPAPFYYHVRQGCFMTAYDEREAVRIFSRQYRSGGNMLTIRFQNPEDYERAQLWTEADCAALNRLLGDAGYNGEYYYWWNDHLRILNIGLYPPAA